MSTQRAKGTAWETAIVNYLIGEGFVMAERRALAGALDKGDITGIPGVVIEAKNCKTINLAQFLDEAAEEATNANADVGVAWVKRRGKTSPAEAYVVMSGTTFIELLTNWVWAK